jgi:Type II secretion system (T2SS), protein E, N-terminal domain
MALVANRAEGQGVDPGMGPRTGSEELTSPRGASHAARQNEGALGARGARAGALFPRCANPDCGTGWMHLWRNRRVPGFEGRWACSEPCMGDLVAAAVRREMDGGDAGSAPYPHRVPMGLMLVEQGRITAEQLRVALESQRREVENGGEARRLGAWLLRSGVLQEPALTRALSAQWNCPVFSLDGFQPAEMAATLPRFLSEACGALPVRAPGGKLLYVAFSGRVDRSLSYALERMNGLRVTAGIAPDSEFRGAQERFLKTGGPHTRFLEAASSWVLARTVTKLIETVKPVEARLARVHDYYWLRMWRRAPEGAELPPVDAVEDLLATVGTEAGRGKRNSG